MFWGHAGRRSELACPIPPPPLSTLPHRHRSQLFYYVSFIFARSYLAHYNLFLIVLFKFFGVVPEYYWIYTIFWVENNRKVSYYICSLGLRASSRMPPTCSCYGIFTCASPCLFISQMELCLFSCLRTLILFLLYETSLPPHTSLIYFVPATPIWRRLFGTIKFPW